jgi:hypothetical protein
MPEMNTEFWSIVEQHGLKVEFTAVPVGADVYVGGVMIPQYECEYVVTSRFPDGETLTFSGISLEECAVKWMAYFRERFSAPCR